MSTGDIEVALTPTSYLVLGCLAQSGPATPYELKQIVAGSVGYFWSFPHSQLYSEPPRLVQAGLATEEREESGRRRRRFAITKPGRQVLRTWVTDPTTAPVEIRDAALLKLYFGQVGTVEQIATLAKTQHDAHVERLGHYRELARAPMADATRATLELGLAYERAATAFWRSIAQSPPRD
jgi:DNA-binding PadR family transcriptional regulator